MTKPGVTDQNGTKFWYNQQNQLHRVNGPAVIRIDGTQKWFRNGKRHRLDGPAIEYADGTEEWWVEGKMHRVGGPAYSNPDGREEWVQNDELHRVDGPAVTRKDGTKGWYQYGKRHRLDGPAIEAANGAEQWVYKDRIIDTETVKTLIPHVGCENAIICVVVHLSMTPHNVQQKTGWKPGTELPPKKLETWRFLAGLTI